MKTATNIMSGSGRALGRKTNGAPKNRGNTRVASSGTQPKLHIRSILVPVDFSSPSIKALKYAAAFAKQFKAKLTLLHVIEPVGMNDFSASYPLVIESDRLVKISEEKLRGLSAKHDLDPALIEKTVVRTGAAFNEITSAARSLKTDLIIIATNGNTGLKHLLLGSTTERVVRHAGCPVFVVREREREIIEPN